MTPPEKWHRYGPNKHASVGEADIDPTTQGEAETLERCPRGCDDGSVLEVTGPGLSGKRTLCTWPGHTSPPPETDDKREEAEDRSDHLLNAPGLGQVDAGERVLERWAGLRPPPPETKEATR